MSEQAADSRRFMQTVRRHKAVVVILAVLGLAAGAGYTVLRPPLLTSQALVVLSTPTQDPLAVTNIMATQVVIADSNPVLAHALQHVRPATSLKALSSRVQVANVAGNVLSISAQGETPAQAKDTANAVTDSYVAYTRSVSGPGGQLLARVLEPAVNGAGPSLLLRLSEIAGLGALIGALIGALAAFVIGRGDRRLRERDEIADSIGVPVLASISVSRPRDVAGWVKLLHDYEAGAVDAWRLQKALHYLRPADPERDTGTSLTILSIYSDRKAIALGPQLASFAASLGIATTLVIGPQQDGNATATLRAACANPLGRSKRSRYLQVTATDHDHPASLPGAALTIVVAVVDGESPQVAGSIRTNVTVLGVSAAAVTADQLARVATSAAADGRDLAGIFVADPDPADHTTGQLPQLARSARRRMPTRMTGTAMRHRP